MIALKTLLTASNNSSPAVRNFRVSAHADNKHCIAPFIAHGVVPVSRATRNC